MKIISMVLFILVTSNLFAEVSTQNEINKSTTTYLEQYEPKVIIQGKWGKGDDEFGIYTKGEVRGPVAMDVDKEGNIYIFDAVNWRVKKYDKEGKLQTTIDLEKIPKEPQEYVAGKDEIKISDNSIFIHPGEELKPYVIKKYNFNGSIVSYIIDGYVNKNVYEQLKGVDEKYYKEIKGKVLGKNKIFDLLKKLGKLTIQNYSDMRAISPKEFIYLEIGEDSIDAPSFSIMPSYYNTRTEHDKVFKQAEYFGIDSVREYLKTLEKSERNKYPSFMESTRYTFLFWSNKKNVKKIEKIIYIKIPNQRWYSPLCEDSSGNVYVFVSTANNDSEKNKIYQNLVIKYNFKGKLVSKYQLFNSVNSIFVAPCISWNGGVYQIVWLENKLNEGFKVIKWEKIN
ncbi:MAG: hypothetical protein PHE88_04550 [Elusimicrobia bacterium]|nr:hypothetical protein [Elusimicrobiota bacterium]